MASNGDFLSYVMGRGAGFRRYAAGKKVYGGGRSAPNIGPVSDKSGYRERDQKALSKRNAMLKRLKAGQRGRYMSSDYLNPNGRS